MKASNTQSDQKSPRKSLTEVERKDKNLISNSKKDFAQQYT